MNRVKIVATIGPVTNNAESLRALRDAGMDIARLNGSHGDPAWHTAAISLIRDVVPDVPILLDIPGRKVRTGVFENDFIFAVGDLFVFSMEPSVNGHVTVPVNYPDLHEDVTIGDEILADDGALRYTVMEIAGRNVTCRVETAGALRTGAGIHLPGATPRENPISERDRTLISFACEQGVDFIGASFVDSPKHVEGIRALVGGPSPGIVAKIETQGALGYVNELATISDALMIDRGDLSMATEVDNIALLQKKVLAEASQAACPVIVATEMLSSMVASPMPRKAEVSDITNAVLDGANALMLSDETAVGGFPVEAVSLMRRVADAASKHIQETLNDGTDTSASLVPQAIGDAIALICRRLNVTKIVAVTISGYAARMVAATIPSQPIIAVSNDPVAARGFNLLRGTTGAYVDIQFSRDSLDHIPLCLETLWQRGDLVDDDLILVTAVGYPKSGNRMNLIETHKVSDLKETLRWETGKANR